MKLNERTLIRRITLARSTLLALGVVLVATGCATGSTGQRTAALDGENDDSRLECIVNRGIRDFTPLDDQNLIIFGPGRRAYHVTLVTPALDLDGEFRLGVYDTDGRICPYGGDAILIDGILSQRVPIRSIQSIDEGEVEALRVEYGRAEAADVEATTITEIQ